MVRPGSEPTSRAANQAILALTTSWICVSVVPSSHPWTRLLITDWLPPASWVFYSCSKLINSFVEGVNRALDRRIWP